MKRDDIMTTLLLAAGAVASGHEVVENSGDRLGERFDRGGARTEALLERQSHWLDKRPDRSGVSIERSWDRRPGDRSRRLK